MAKAKVQAQIGLEDEWIRDAELEALLEERQSLREALGQIRKDFGERDARAKGSLLALELPDEGEYRCGRFLISMGSSEATHVEFDRQAKTKVKIKVAKE